MGLKVTERNVVRFDVSWTKKYVPGTRLKIGFEGGETLYFREMRLGTDLHEVKLVLDETLSSKKILRSLRGPAGGASAGPRASADSGSGSEPPLLDTVAPTGPAASAVFYYMDAERRWRGDFIELGMTDLSLIASSFPNRSSGSGVTVTRKLLSAEVVRIEGAP